MGEHRIFVDNLRFNYEGAFAANELFRTIGNYLYDKGYDKKPFKEFEQNTPRGKHIELQLHPWKKTTDYIRHEMQIRIIVEDLTKRQMVLNGRNQTVDFGKVLIVINGYMETDYDQHWEDTPVFVFLRTIYDKWIFKRHYEQQEYIARDHVNQLYALIQRFFNVYTATSMRTEPNSIALHD